MVLLVLAVLWAVVLVPPALRSRAENRRARSVETFRHRLQVLAPPEPPRAAGPAVAVRPVGSVWPAAAVATPVSFPARAPRAAGAWPAVPAPVPPSRAAGAWPAVPAPAFPARDAALPPAPAPARPARTPRAVTLRRRRRVLLTLVLAGAATLALGFHPALRWGWAVHVVVDVALAAYVAGLRRLQRLAAERAAKVRYLPVGAAAPAGDLPARRSASW